MTCPVVALFTNKGGVGKTSLVYHLSWICADLGLRVVAADLDPQANLTAMFLPEERVEELWPDTGPRLTLFGAVQPQIEGTGDISPAHVEEVHENLALVVGDVRLSSCEQLLSEMWPGALTGEVRYFRPISAFWRVLQEVAARRQSELILLDLGPNLGALNRAGLLAADYVLFPLAPDLFSLQGLRNLGPTLVGWRSGWQERRGKFVGGFDLPRGTMGPAGYVVMQHSVRLDRPVGAYSRWIEQIPRVYAEAILNIRSSASLRVEDDPQCLKQLKHYRSLMPMAEEARKPIFHLKPADGAQGAHLTAAIAARADFVHLARQLSEKIGVELPQL